MAVLVPQSHRARPTIWRYFSLFIIDFNIDLLYKAYIFRTDAHDPNPIGEPQRVEVVRGSVLDEIQIYYDGTYKQRVRLYHQPRHGFFAKSLEILYEIGPLPQDTEVVTRFHHMSEDECEFHTDSNGLWSIPRPSNTKNPAGNDISMF